MDGAANAVAKLPFCRTLCRSINQRLTEAMALALLILIRYLVYTILRSSRVSHTSCRQGVWAENVAMKSG